MWGKRQRWTSIIWLATVAVAPVACNAERPALTDASSDMQIPCSEFADLLVAFTPGSGGPSEAGVSALGAPDADVVSLGIDATITVAFIGAGAIIDATGNDVRLHLSSSSDASAVAYASEDGDDFRFLGDINGGLDAPLDLDLATPSLSSALQIRIVGTGGNISLDAVEGLSIDCNTP